jgi:hypothetical protein
MVWGSKLGLTQANIVLPIEHNETVWDWACNNLDEAVEALRTDNPIRFRYSEWAEYRPIPDKGVYLFFMQEPVVTINRDVFGLVEHDDLLSTKTMSFRDLLPKGPNEFSYVLDPGYFDRLVHVKIGISDIGSVRARLKKISIGNPYPIELLHVIETDDAEVVEAFWHGAFRHSAASHDEWFHITFDELNVFMSVPLMNKPRSWDGQTERIRILEHLDLLRDWIGDNRDLRRAHEP